MLKEIADFAHVEQDGTCSDYLACFIKASDTGCIVIRLPVQQVCANLVIADKLGSQEPISNGLTCYTRRVKLNAKDVFGGNDDILHTPVRQGVCIRQFSSRMDGNRRR
jgi:hypothetical protein